MFATFNITNNRLFFWPDERLPEDQYKAAKSAGFVWWPRGCFTAIWSPTAEDFILQTLGLTIEDDDTPDDVESRVNRYEKYASNDERDAQRANERLTSGAANTARRIRLAEGVAERKTDEAAYWHNRAAAAISHAQYKDRPDVIARRIKGLEADKRKQERVMSKQETIGRYDHLLWSWKNDHGFIFESKQEERDGKLYITGGWNRTMTEEEKAEFLEWAKQQDAPTIDRARRWIEHLTRRIEYENAYLQAVGGKPSDNIELKPGMVLQDGRYVIEKVNKTTVLVKTPYGHLKIGKEKAAMMVNS